MWRARRLYAVLTRARHLPPRRDAGVALSAAEEELKALLIMHRVLIPARDGRCALA